MRFVAAILLYLVLGSLGYAAQDETTYPPTLFDTFPPPGIINPDFIPQCDYIDGVYVCTDFARDYCRQFEPRRDCEVLWIWDRTKKSVNHVINITRVYVGNGMYLYCVVEPQTNEIVEDSCWEDREDHDPFIPRKIQRAICEEYPELQCKKGRIPGYRRMYDLPNEFCHPLTGGCRQSDEPKEFS